MFSYFLPYSHRTDAFCLGVFLWNVRVNKFKDQFLARKPKMVNSRTEPDPQKYAGERGRVLTPSRQSNMWTDKLDSQLSSIKYGANQTRRQVMASLNEM